MKSTYYDPYLYNPDNTYLTITADLPYTDPSDQPSRREKRFSKKASKPLKRTDSFQSLSAWLYFQLQYHIIVIFVVATVLILGLLLSSGAFLLLLK